MALRRNGYTLPELLVVLVIILLVSVFTVPFVRRSYSERSIIEATQLVQAAFIAAQSEAIGSGRPGGIRFLADPTLPGAANRLTSIAPAPDYSEGMLSMTDFSTLPDGFVVPYPCLMVEQAGPMTFTSWPGNIRVGDQIQLGVQGPWYTIAGPTDPANPTSEGFVTPTQVLDRKDGRGPLDYLYLVNGLDDDKDGFVDNGWDGVDNNGNGVIDETAEWEVEKWRQPTVTSGVYLIHRRPIPNNPTRVIDLPASIVINAPPGDFLFGPLGEVRTIGSYAVPTSYCLTGPAGSRDLFHEVKVHLVDRGAAIDSKGRVTDGTDEAWVTVNVKNGDIETQNNILYDLAPPN